KPAANPAPKATAAVVTGTLPSRDDLTTAWADAILPKLSRKVAVWFKGRFASVDDAAVFAVEDNNFLARAEKYKGEVEAALAAHSGPPFRMRLTAATAAPPPKPAADGAEDDIDSDAPVADGAPASPEDHLKAAFPGAEEVSDE